MPTKAESAKQPEEVEVKEIEQPKNQVGKEDKATQNIIMMPRPPLSFPQRLVKKPEEGKYCKFISMLKQL